MLITPWESMIGSLWLGSPLLRMQAAHLSTKAVGCYPSALWPWCARHYDRYSSRAIALVGRLATVRELADDGELEPPHAASAIAAPERIAASPTDRLCVVVTCLCPSTPRLRHAMSALGTFTCFCASRVEELRRE